MRDDKIKGLFKFLESQFEEFTAFCKSDSVSTGSPLETIVKSDRIITQMGLGRALAKASMLDMELLKKKNPEELRKLRVVKVQWNKDGSGDTGVFGMTLSDGTSCKAGSENFNGG